MSRLADFAGALAPEDSGAGRRGRIFLICLALSLAVHGLALLAAMAWRSDFVLLVPASSVYNVELVNLAPPAPADRAGGNEKTVVASPPAVPAAHKVETPKPAVKRAEPVKKAVATPKPPPPAKVVERPEPQAKPQAESLAETPPPPAAPEMAEADEVKETPPAPAQEAAVAEKAAGRDSAAKSTIAESETGEATKSLEAGDNANSRTLANAAPRDRDDGSRAYELGEVDEKPGIIEAVQPVYPAWARRRNVTGVVTVGFEVDTGGGVRKLRILRAEPRGVFEDSVKQAVVAWRFSPARIGGRPVVARVTLPIRFNLD